MDRVGTPRRLVMFALAAGIFAAAASTRLLDSLLPEIARNFHESVAATGMAVTAYSFSYSLCQLLFGPLGDRIGPLRIAIAAAGVAGLAALGCALSGSLSTLIAARLIAGAMPAGIAPMALAWVSHATDAGERPVVVANMTGASIVGATAGQVGGGLIGGWLGWQACFLTVAALFLLACGALVWMSLKESDLTAIGRRDPQGDGARPPGLLALLRRGRVRALLAFVGIEGFALYMSLTYISVLLHGRLGLGLAEIGLLIGCLGLGGICFVLGARAIVARLGDAWRARAGGALAGAGFLLLLLVHSPIAAAAALAITGFGFAMIHNLFQVRATHVAPDAAGSAISLFAAAFFLAQSLGAAFGSWAVAHLGIASLCAMSCAVLLMLGLFVGHHMPKPAARVDA